LFEKLKVKSLKYKASQLPDKPEGKYVLPALTAGIQNQGLNNFVPIENITILKNVISISANGANTGATFYQNKNFTILQDAYAIDWKYTNDNLNDNHYLYLTATISKTIFGNYEWTYKAGWERIKSKKIQLPTKNGKIDFEFMESFISEVEAELIAKLQAYLQATGLKDYVLTDEEQEVLKVFESGGFEWGEYRLGDLFEVVGTKSLDSNAVDFVKKGVNFVGRTFENNGVQGKIQKRNFEPNEPFTITATVIGNYKYVKYQREPYYCSQNINKLIPKEIITKWNKQVAYFFVINIQKFVSLYDYQQGGYKLNDIKNYVLQLATKNGEPDYHLMQTLISAVQKLVIKEVVEYAEAKMEVVQKIVNN
jgi:hypothetical protein